MSVVIPTSVSISCGAILLWYLVRFLGVPFVIIFNRLDLKDMFGGTFPSYFDCAVA